MTSIKRIDALACTASAEPEWAVVTRRVKEVSEDWDHAYAAERSAKLVPRCCGAAA